MNQIVWEKEWLLFLKNYVRPLQERAFIGYFHDVRCRIVFRDYVTLDVEALIVTGFVACY